MYKIYKPKIFLGSSFEALPIVKKAASRLRDHFEVCEWDNDVFENGKVTINVLIERAAEFDYALMLFMPDDILLSKGRKYGVTRDNVIFETGIFMRVLGKQRVAIVIGDLTSEQNKKIPTRFLSDMDGVTYLHRFQIPQSKFDVNNLGNKIDTEINTFCDKLIDKIKKDKNSQGIRALKDSYFQTQEDLRRMVEKDELDFELPILKWRIDTEREKYQKIKGGNWEIIADDNYPYMRLVFMNLMDTLEKGDKYFTVTNLKFWSKGRYKVSEFYSQNKASLEKGIIIQRVMLLDKKLLEIEDNRLLLHEIIDKFVEIGISNLISFLVYDKAPDSDALKHVPYAVVKREKISLTSAKSEKYLTIIPTLNEDRSPKINVVFKQSSVEHRQCLNLFNDCWDSVNRKNVNAMLAYLKTFKTSAGLSFRQSKKNRKP